MSATSDAPAKSDGKKMSDVLWYCGLFFALGAGIWTYIFLMRNAGIEGGLAVTSALVSIGCFIRANRPI